ncbi:Hypothetical protein SMAX5B_009179, partial [Scophthalmus maximus]
TNSELEGTTSELGNCDWNASASGNSTGPPGSEFRGVMERSVSRCARGPSVFTSPVP